MYSLIVKHESEINSIFGIRVKDCSRKTKTFY
jgi:hypothetical protein